MKFTVITLEKTGCISVLYRCIKSTKKHVKDTKNMAFPTKMCIGYRKTIGIIMMLMAFCVSSFCVNAESIDRLDSAATDSTEEGSEAVNLTSDISELYRIEQVRAVAPYIRAFFYPDESFGSDIQLDGYLGGKELTLLGINSWKNMGMGIDYYFILDNSQSVDEKDFEKLKQELAQLPSFMASKDTVTIYVGGDYSKKKAEKLSSSKSVELQQVLDSILRDGMDSSIYDAINAVAADIAGQNMSKVYEETSNIEEGLELGRNRSIIVIVSDAVDEPDNAAVKDETIKKLNYYNIPLFIIQQNAQGENGNEKRDDMPQVARQTGGEYIKMADQISGGSIEELVTRVNSCMVATFESDNNKTSDEEISFNIVYGMSGDSKDLRTFDSKGVIIRSHMKDSSKPTVEKVDMSNDHTIRVEYSENISEESKNVRLYEISDERGNTYKPTGADYSVDGKNVLILTTSAKLYNGSYRLNILSGVTDDTEEKNKLEEVSKDVTFSGGEDYTEKNDIFLTRYIWIILGGSILLFSIIVIAVVINTVRKRMRVG
jgi:hypothetical protein